MEECLGLAVGLAREAGRLQMERLRLAHTIERKEVTHIVTEVDRECERIIVDGIRRQYPDHDIYAEEGTGDRRNSEFCWIIDPLDGTTNYAHQFPFFGVSIALKRGDKIIVGAVFNPNRDEMFEAVSGSGAMLNGRSIHVSAAENLDDSLLATGFAYVRRDDRRVENIDHFENFVRRGIAVRRPGAAAIDLAYVACGRLDGFWEIKLKAWDMAAGALLIEEAGGRVTGFEGGPLDLFGNTIVATNGLLHDEMLKELNKDAWFVDREA